MIQVSGLCPQFKYLSNAKLVFEGFRVARVRLLFKLPSQLVPDSTEVLAYVDWFKALKPTPYSANGLYRLEQQSKRYSSIIKADRIIRSCHLIPFWPSQSVDTVWRSSTVLDNCKVFYLNKYLDMYTFAYLLQ